MSLVSWFIEQRRLAREAQKLAKTTEMVAEAYLQGRSDAYAEILAEAETALIAQKGTLERFGVSRVDSRATTREKRQRIAGARLSEATAGRKLAN